MTNRNDRIETLRQNGIDISNFFDLSLRIPFGATVTLNINGQQLVATGGFDANMSESIAANGNITSVNSNGNTVVLGGYTYSGENLPTDDPIIQNIMDSGYVFNSRTDGRFVCAQTFRMLNEKSYNIKTRQYEYGWDNYLRNSYGFMYQFDMMKDEVHKLARMERNNDTEFERLSSFFTKEVIIATCEHYIRQLRKFVNKQKRRKCHGIPYVKLNKYGNVFVRDLNDKVFSKLKTALNNMNNCSNYEMLERHLKRFINAMAKLPYETPKSSAWKDAFKGKGAYMTLLNIVKFHGVNVLSYETGELLNRDNSIAYVESKLVDYRNQYWKFHELLKATITANNFDLKQSIDAQNNVN